MRRVGADKRAGAGIGGVNVRPGSSFIAPIRTKSANIIDRRIWSKSSIKNKQRSRSPRVYPKAAGSNLSAETIAYNNEMYAARGRHQSPQDHGNTVTAQLPNAIFNEARSSVDGYADPREEIDRAVVRCGFGRESSVCRQAFFRRPPEAPLSKPR